MAALSANNMFVGNRSQDEAGDRSTQAGGTVALDDDMQHTSRSEGVDQHVRQLCTARIQGLYCSSCHLMYFSKRWSVCSVNKFGSAQRSVYIILVLA